MKNISVKITEGQRRFLDLIQHEDAASNLSEAVQWCIDACMRIEENYGVDACYVSFHDMSTKEHNSFTPLTPTGTLES